MNPDKPSVSRSNGPVTGPVQNDKVFGTTNIDNDLKKGVGDGSIVKGSKTNK